MTAPAGQPVVSFALSSLDSPRPAPLQSFLMSNLTIQRVTTARQRKQFLHFPWTLYRNDPNWIPPLRGSAKEMVNFRSHPFYDRNACQTFLAYRGDEVCGRIAAILNQGHIAQHNDRRGFFGFFDCTDDQEAANGLFDAVRQWFDDQDIHRLRGPTNPSLNYELGLLVDGFDSPPTFMMTYNPPYYERLVENYGFRKTQDLYAFWGHVEMLPKIRAKLQPIAQQIIERYNVKLRPLDRKRFQQDVEMFLDLYNRSLASTWGFVPMSASELKQLAGELKKIIVPELTVCAEVDGRVVGASFGLPDYNPRIRDIDGRLFPFGFIHLLLNKRAIKRIRLISTNVLPEYQRFGIGMVLMSGLVPKVLEWGIEEAEFSWVLESNRLSYGALKKGGAKITKTYRLYDLDEGGEKGEGREESGNDERGMMNDESEKAGKVARPSSIIIHPSSLSTAPLEVREVRSRADLDRFIKLPWRIYADDPHWVPPLLKEVNDFLNRRKHPFYRHGDAAQFIATRGGETVGRILVSDDPRYNEERGENLGCFGMFECDNDEAAAHGLLDTAAVWLSARGRTAIRGPIDYSVNYPCGLLVEGFDTPPRVMMNHNRRYFAGLLESWGLRKAMDLYAWWFVDPRDLAAKWRGRAERLARRGRIKIRPFNLRDFHAEVDRCQQVYNAAMSDLWGFVKLSEAEFEHMAGQLKQLAIADQVLLAEIEGRAVGFSITLPDMNEAIRPLNGRLTRFGLPLGVLKLMRWKQRVTTARMVVLDVLKEYRRRGVAEMLILHTLDYGKNVLGYTGAELSWTLEDNVLVNRTIEAVGGRRYKTYRIYQKDLPPQGIAGG
jgi:GNAT superfamily N-acetyltransferase